jgi:hypothetical protein
MTRPTKERLAEIRLGILLNGDRVRERDLLAKIDALTAALKDLVEGFDEALSYVPDYFQDKWALPAYLERAREALENK